MIGYNIYHLTGCRAQMYVQRNNAMLLAYCDFVDLEFLCLCVVITFVNPFKE